jgi:hypothetical protein
VKKLIIAGIVLSVSGVAFAGSSIKVNSNAQVSSGSYTTASNTGGAVQLSGAGASNQSTASLTSGDKGKTVQATTQTYGLTGSFAIGANKGDAGGSSSSWSDQSGSAKVTEHSKSSGQ